MDDENNMDQTTEKTKKKQEDEMLSALHAARKDKLQRFAQDLTTNI